MDMVDEMAARGLRVLAVARRACRGRPAPLSWKTLRPG